VSKGIVALIAVAAFMVGGVVGCVTGVAVSEAGRELLSGATLVEREADVRNPVTITQPGFTLQHPGNWEYDLTNANHDPEHYFYIDTPGGSYIEVSFEEKGTDPNVEYDVAQENLDLKLSQYEDYVSSPTTVPFDTYGKFKGKGVILTGRYLGSRITMRAFSYVEGEKTLVVFEHTYDMDRNLVKPGMDLIERSLTLK
jgi:hypothetical protein